jgi:hypothetical protein
MRSTILLILAAILALASLMNAQDGGRTATATWQVQKYDIEATMPADGGRTVNVKALLSLKNISGRPATSVTLRISPAAEITSVRVNDAVTDFSKAEEKSAAVSLQRIGTRVASVAADGVAKVVVDYKITPKDNTALASISGTQSQLLPLSYWYPTPNSWYFPRGADNSPVRLKVTAANGASIVSAGTETAGVFEHGLFAQPFFIAGNWDVSNSGGVSVYLPKGGGAEAQKRAAELAALFTEARTFAGTMLGKMPETPLRLVAVRRGGGFASGGTALVDEAVFRRPKIDSLSAMNLAEAAARLYLGNVVAVNGEGYGIISEGLVRYVATQFIESKFGKDVADIERLRQRNAYLAVSKRDAPMAIVSPIDDYYYQVVANKGAMVWRIISRKVGSTELANILKTSAQDGALNVAEIRQALSSQKPLVDMLFDQITEMNLMVGLPQPGAGETRAAVRNFGNFDVTVDVVGTTATGQRLSFPVTIATGSPGEVVFKTSEKVTRIEVDADKLYPQTEYFDDVAPREATDSDPLLAVKRTFDKQEFAAAEALARTLVRDYPRFDDLRILFARSLLAQGKTADAEREFKVVLDEKLPTSRSVAWANVGLAEIAAKAGQNDAALKYAETVIAIDAEYGASFAARNIRNRLSTSAPNDPAIKSFFADFDRAAAANRKADLESLAVPGEVAKFVNGIAGSTEQWQTTVRQIDRVDANTVLVEVGLSIKLLNKEVETGIAVFRLAKAGSSWKLSAVDMFEVR